MSRRSKTLLTITTGVFIVVVAVVLAATTTPNGAVATGDLIIKTDLSDLHLTAWEPNVGDAVMFLGAVPDVAGAQSIEVVEVTLPDGPAAMRLVGARVHETKDFDDGAAVAAWQSRNGEGGDPRRRPSIPLIGLTLTGATDPAARFLMYEFLVCAPGTATVEAIEVTYRHDSKLYRQTLRVVYTIEDATPSAYRC